MFSYWLRADLCWRLFSAINQFARTDRIKRRHKYISRQDRRVCTQVALCSLLLSVDRKINGISEPIVFLASFQLFFFFFFWLRTVFQPLFSFLINFSDKWPSLPRARSEVCHGASSPDHISTLYFCYVSECFGGCFLLTRALGVGLRLEEKAGTRAVGENHERDFSGQVVNKNSPGHITSRMKWILSQYYDFWALIHAY